MVERTLQFLNFPLLLVGCFISPVIRLLFPGVRYGYDVTTFVEWGTYADKIKDLYNTPCYCNYPIVGLLSSTGILKLFDFNISQYMIALSLFDFINVLLAFFILKNLKVAYAGIWSFAIAAIPSTWAGAALWGQIDNVGQTILLLIVLTIVVFYNRKLYSKYFNLFLVFQGLLFSLAILTKQLLLFSLLPLGIFILHIIYLQNFSSLINSAKQVLGFLLMIIIPIILFDKWLTLPSEYSISHLQRVFLTGSDHMDIISGNGFNIWVLFYQNLLSNSTTEILGVISPKFMGLILFIISFFVISYLLMRRIKAQSSHELNKSHIINYILYLALINLSFNVLLTGTHDRYLYHCYPFLLIAIISAAQDYKSILKNKNFYISIVAASVYGAFILSILLMIKPFYINKFLALFHLSLFIYLISLYSGRKKII